MQAKASAKVSSMEGQLLSWAQMTGTQCADSRQIGEALRFDTVQCRNLLDKMNRRGIIVQLKRGLYLLPQKLPPGGKWQPSADMAIWFFMKYRNAKWQETGATVFNYYGLTEQVANQTVIYNDKISAKRKFGRLSVVFVKVATSRIGGVTVLDLPSELEIKRKVGSLARVILDGVYDYGRFGTLPNAYRWIEARKTDEAFLKELVDLSLCCGNVASRRRIGWLLERLAVNPSIYRPLLKSLTPSKSFIPADPSVPKRGKTNIRWNVVENYYP
jgi:predicted transcriptional regulator of viral defense system